MSTPLYLLNFILLQWFYGRLAKEVEEDEVTIIRWLWLRNVVPFSGFGGRPYKRRPPSLLYIMTLTALLTALAVGLAHLVKP